MRAPHELKISCTQRAADSATFRRLDAGSGQHSDVLVTVFEGGQLACANITDGLEALRAWLGDEAVADVRKEAADAKAALADAVGRWHDEREALAAELKAARATIERLETRELRERNDERDELLAQLEEERALNDTLSAQAKGHALAREHAEGARTEARRALDALEEGAPIVGSPIFWLGKMRRALRGIL